ALRHDDQGKQKKIEQDDDGDPQEQDRGVAREIHGPARSVGPQRHSIPAERQLRLAIDSCLANLLAIEVRAIRAVEIADYPAVGNGLDRRMIAGDANVANDKVVIRAAADANGPPVDCERLTILGLELQGTRGLGLAHTLEAARALNLGHYIRGLVP